MILAKFEEESKKTKIKRSKSVTTAAVAASSTFLNDKKTVDRNETRRIPDHFGISNGETLVVDPVTDMFYSIVLFNFLSQDKMSSSDQNKRR